MESNNLVFSLLLILLYLHWCACENQCKAKDECDGKQGKEMYNKVWNKYMKLYEEANENYVPCENSLEDCECYMENLENDLKPFRKISLNTLNETRNTSKHSVTYQIINGEVYRSKDCLFPMRCQGIEHFLLKLAKEDLELATEIVVNTHDWPFINRHFNPNPLPMFSFSKTQPDHYDISYPAWTFWAGGPATKLYPRGLGRWDQMRKELLRAASESPWSKKQDKAFFRGSRTSSERDNLVLLSRKNPELIDAKYTKNQAWKSIKDTLGEEPASEVALESHCVYKYLFNFRGVAASFRYKHLFLCGSLVLNVGGGEEDTEWTEFFYSALKPWVHYVPMSSTASQDQIEEVIQFLESHQEIAEKIASAGQSFVKNNLKMSHIHCYWKKLISAYTALLDFKPERNQHFIHIA